MNTQCTYSAQGCLSCKGLPTQKVDAGVWDVRGVDAKGYAIPIHEVPPFEETPTKDIQGFSERLQFAWVQDENKSYNSDVVSAPIFDKNSMF